MQSGSTPAELKQGKMFAVLGVVMFVVLWALIIYKFLGMWTPMPLLTW